MKTIKHLFTALLLLCATVATAHDFEVDGIYYEITDATNKTVGVTYRGASYSDYSNEYTDSVVIPESVTYNGIVYSVTSIGDHAFEYCIFLTSVEIPNSVTSIGREAFDCCLSLTSVEIPNSVTSIGVAAFSNCSRLTSIEIPNSVTSIGDYAFYGCSGLESIEIPNSVTSIGDNAFDGCFGLTSVEIPNSVTSIGGEAFRACDGLTSIEIPNSVTSIGDYAFSNCFRLTSIEIPNSVTSIGVAAFIGCSGGLESITVAADNSVYDSREGCNAIIETASNTLVAGCKNTVIPNSVTSIGDWAFGLCTGLTSIEIPNSVTSIGEKAFRDCDGLTSIEIPNSVTSIGNEAFGYCFGLTSVEIPNSVTSIGDNAFWDCYGLTSVTIGNSVTSIGEWAFGSCYGLTSIISHIPAGKLFSLNSNAFNNVDKTNCTLYVPYGAKEKYAATDGWREFENIVELPDAFDLTVTSVGYASLYLSSAVEIPLDVEVYTATAVEGDLLKMQQVTGILPANTGAIVKADAGTYRFNYSDENPAAIEGNLLLGTTTSTYIKPTAGTAAYLLSQVDGIVGMYLAELNGEGRFLNNANNAYMLLGEIDTSAPGTQLSAGYRFDFGGTTGVEKVEMRKEKVEMRKEKVEIYDLQGRRVEHPTKGLYIVNGRVMLVK